MKNLALLLLMVMLPLTAAARDVNVCAHWNLHPQPTALIKIDYWINNGNSARLGTVNADKTQMCKIVDLQPGDEVCGHIWSQMTINSVTKTSPKSAKACAVYFPDLTTPEGLFFVTNPAPVVP